MGRNYFRDAVDFTRGALRKRRLEDIEHEQSREEAWALKVTRDQLQALHQSFASVKVEFSDLDGQRWTESTLRTRSQQTHMNALRARAFTEGSLPPPSKNGGFAVLSNADLASFSPDETIRASGQRRRPRVFERCPPSISTSPTFTTPSRRSAFPSSQEPVFTLFSESMEDEIEKVDADGPNQPEGSKPSIDAIEDEFLSSLEPLILTEISDEDDDDDDPFLSLDEFPLPVTEFGYDLDLDEELWQ
ncbi:hypothetical protein BDN72DRAFT_522668 [Pluteus cervinus]|uniref:Uncharacterized protein n=1 Tax=Pluteus cervinus TaxID=181527 RepID=A0ACD3AZN7_9AGAR|nr:hypothetical protein BDN72DRAFT_522668 [Pluteus cervinus]